MFYAFVCLVLGSVLGSFWSLPFLLTPLINVYLYKIDGRKVQVLTKNIKYSSVLNNDEPESWIVGKWFVGYISSSVDEPKTVYLLTTSNIYKYLLKNECLDSTINTNTKLKQIDFYEKDGSYWNTNYTSRKIDLTTHKSRHKQTLITNSIIKGFEKHKYFRCVISGEAGTGKSMVSQFVAKSMIKTFKHKVCVVDTWNPTTPNDFFISLYEKIESNSVLIVVIEEIDRLIHLIHEEKTHQHKNLPTQITDKTSWNQFLDRFDRNFYKNVILIMTTNKPLEYIDSLDPSYLRLGRVDKRFNL